MIHADFNIIQVYMSRNAYLLIFPIFCSAFIHLNLSERLHQTFFLVDIDEVNIYIWFKWPQIK